MNPLSIIIVGAALADAAISKVAITPSSGSLLEVNRLAQVVALAFFLAFGDCHACVSVDIG
jgi:hypothetical protein